MENIGYMIRCAMEVESKIIFYTVILIFSAITRSLLTTYLPKIIVKGFAAEQLPEEIIIKSLTLIVALAIVTATDNYASSVVFWNTRTLRFYFINKFNEQRMKMNYQKLIHPETQKLLNLARMAISKDSAPAQNFLSVVADLTIAMISFLIFGLLLALKNPSICILVAVTAVGNYQFMKYLREKKKAARQEVSVLE